MNGQTLKATRALNIVNDQESKSNLLRARKGFPESRSFRKVVIIPK